MRNKLPEIVFITVWIVILVAFVYWFFLLFTIGKEIDKQGGLGSSIGKFINSVKKEIE